MLSIVFHQEFCAFLYLSQAGVPRSSGIVLRIFNIYVIYFLNLWGSHQQLKVDSMTILGVGIQPAMLLKGKSQTSKSEIIM